MPAEPIAWSLDRSKLDAGMVSFPGTQRRSLSRWIRSQHFQSVWESMDPGTVETRPPHPYTELIKLCILKRREGKLTLNQLYRDLEDKFPFFASSAKGKGWKNTLRHNLSTQPYFIKLEREHGQLGKGHYWAYCPDLEKPTSLAQSSVVQLSSLWPPSATSASAALPDILTSAASSWADLALAPHSSPSARSPPMAAGADRPRWDRRRDSFHVRLERSRYLSETGAAGAADEAERFEPANTPPRRFSGPVLASRGARNDPVGLLRMRAATVSSARPQSEPERRTRFWPPPASSPTSPWSECSRDSGERRDDVAARPALPTLPELPPTPPRTSLGDYYLSHPIATRRSRSPARSALA